MFIEIVPKVCGRPNRAREMRGRIPPAPPPCTCTLPRRSRNATNCTASITVKLNCYCKGYRRTYYVSVMVYYLHVSLISFESCCLMGDMNSLFSINHVLSSNCREILWHVKTRLVLLIGLTKRDSFCVYTSINKVKLQVIHHM